MILDKQIIVPLGAKNIKYYESLGYQIPYGIDKKKRRRVEKEKGLLVYVKDIPITSPVLVNVNCEDCGAERKVQYGTIVGRLNSSFHKNGETLCSSCANSRMSGENSAAYIHGNSLYPMYRNNARRRGISFDLDVKEFEALIPSNCYYCSDKSNGIDRWNSNLGYTINNCVPCCKECNFLKNNTNPDLFIERIKKMYNTLKIKGLI
jgi:hypothetical protein